MIVLTETWLSNYVRDPELEPCSRHTVLRCDKHEIVLTFVVVMS